MASRKPVQDGTSNSRFISLAGPLSGPDAAERTTRAVAVDRVADQGADTHQVKPGPAGGPIARRAALRAASVRLVSDLSHPSRAAAQRRSIGTLSAAAVLGGIAVSGSIPIGALIAASLAGEAVAGLAQTMGVVGAAVMALPLARIALTRGRRAALSTGYGLGAAGAATVLIGGVTRSLGVVFVGCFFVGVATAANYQARYAATDLATEHTRARSLSIVLWAGTVGAFIGPNLLAPSGQVAMTLGLPQLTGPYLVSAVLFSAATVVLVLRLRPDPYLLARQWSSEPGGDGGRPTLVDGLAHLQGSARARLGVYSVSVGHMVMVMVMVMTPIHMSHVDVSLQVMGLVISLHILSMYVLAPGVGWVVDRYGRLPVITAGAAMLLLACVVCAWATPNDVATLTIGLVLLGIGWSGSVIAGSTLVTDDAPEAKRPSVQGLSDLAMNVAAAIGGAAAGIIVSRYSFAALCGMAVLPVIGLLCAVGNRSLSDRRVRVGPWSAHRGEGTSEPTTEPSSSSRGHVPARGSEHRLIRWHMR